MSCCLVGVSPVLSARTALLDHANQPCLGAQILGDGVADVGQNIFDDGARYTVRVLAGELSVVFEGFSTPLHPLLRDFSHDTSVSAAWSNAHIRRNQRGWTPGYSRS